MRVLAPTGGDDVTVTAMTGGETADDENQMDAGKDETDEAPGSDGQPGFGVAVAVLAVPSAATLPAGPDRSVRHCGRLGSPDRNRSFIMTDTRSIIDIFIRPHPTSYICYRNVYNGVGVTSC